MNKEIGYVWQGFFLLLIILSGISIISQISIIESVETENENLAYCGVQEPADIAAITHPRGAELFSQNCATCHRIEKDLTGPALRGVEDRVKDQKLLYTWIRNNEAVLKSGNPYFTDLYKKWNQTPMNVFPALTDDEIADILSYIRFKRDPLPSPDEGTVME